jgi:hypothetical protein
LFDFANAAQAIKLGEEAVERGLEEVHEAMAALA